MTDVRVLRVTQGFNGWSPRLAVITDGARSVLKLVGWTGGTGNVPPYDLYLGAIGYVTDIEDAVDIRGDNAYLYVAYADDASGTGFTLTFDDTKHYIAIKQTTSPIASPIASDFAGLWVIYSGNPDLSDYLTIANSRYQFISSGATSYLISQSAVTPNGNTIIEFSNNSLTSIIVNTSTGTGKTAGDSVTLSITGTYGAQTLVADGVTINGNLAFSNSVKIKTLIYRGSNTWTVLGG